MFKTEDIALYDQQVVAKIIEKQVIINATGLAPNMRICAVRTWRVLRHWTGTNCWDGLAEAFAFAEPVTDQDFTAIAEGTADDSGLKNRVRGKNPLTPRIAASRARHMTALGWQRDHMGWFLRDACKSEG